MNMQQMIIDYVTAHPGRTVLLVACCIYGSFYLAGVGWRHGRDDD